MLVAIAVFLAAVWGVLEARAISARTIEVDPLIPAKVATKLVPEPVRYEVARLRAPAARAVQARPTVLGKAEALRDVVRAGIAPGVTDCFGYATVMVALGRSLGLPVKLVIGGAGYSDYDTHTTVSVWMPRWRRWGLVDPTFGGIWTWRGSEVPLRAADLRDAVLAGRENDIVFRSSHRKNATMPSKYYVDPIQLFRYIGTIGWDGKSTTAVTAPDSTMLFADALVVHLNPLQATSPTQTYSTTMAARSGVAATPTRLHLPPLYAKRVVLAKTVRLPATVKSPAGSIVAWISIPGVTVAGYTTALVDGGSLSPIMQRGSLRIAGHGQATVLLYSVRRASPANER